MVWTYSGDPSTNDRDAVRFEIGDTQQEDKQLQDEEIDYVLLAKGGIHSAAVHCCEILALKYARLAEYRLGPMQVKANQRAEAYRLLASELRNRVFGKNLPYVGGLSKDERYTDRLDPNLVQPKFKHDLMKNRGG